MPFYTTLSRNVASVFEISAVNLMVGWCEFACVMNLSMSGFAGKLLETLQKRSFHKTLHFEAKTNDLHNFAMSL